MSTDRSDFTVDTAKERDYLLDYKSVDLMSLRRTAILDFPIDNVTRDEAVALVLHHIEQKQGPAHVIFVDPVKLMRLRSSRRLQHLNEGLNLILADGAGLLWGAERLGQPLKERIPMIAMLMDIVRLAWKTELTIYFLGDKSEYLERVFANMQRSFPGVRIIGRQAGSFNAAREALIKESIRKSSPDIIFIGMGFPAQELWIHENRDHLANAVVIGIDEAFGILSGKMKRAPDWFQLRGLAWFWQVLTKPFLLDRLIATIAYFVKVLWVSFRQKP
ncbi:MAG: WecB/TagA/CpsF family glycosyltransferase [Leptospiraceae bacterium]|nr:WecB/TagA/CpsF family glycosyltransferase [Leptospiraceae bacterium]